MSITSTPVASVANGPSFVWLMYVHKWCMCPATVVAYVSSGLMLYLLVPLHGDFSIKPKNVSSTNLVGGPVEGTGHSS